MTTTSIKFDPKCIHCVLTSHIIEFLRANPEADRVQVIYDMGTLVAEMIQGLVSESEWITAVHDISQSIKADVFGYSRDALMITVQDSKRVS